MCMRLQFVAPLNTLAAWPLSHYLQVPQAVVKRWIAGKERPTGASFLKMVDLLLDHDVGFGDGKS